MRRKFNRLTSLLIAVTIIMSLLPVSFASAAQTFPDFPTGWSKPAMEAAVNNGLISGYEDGTVRPKGNLTRAEMTTIITKAFGATTTADISNFADVENGSWYYDSISRAVKMGAIAGRSTTEMAPNAYITRQEVFSILARVLVLSNEDTSSLNKFGDVNDIASWAAPSMAALTERGYVNGDDKGNANPQDYITREEFAQLMYMAIRTYITKSGTYTTDLEGITVVRVGDVTIKGVKNSSDLVIGDGTGEGEIIIENVTVEKRLLARGGSIKLDKTTLGENVVVNNVNGITYFDNYKDEDVFKGIVENTVAKFKERSTGGGGGGGGGGETPPSPTQITLDYSPLPYGATWINQPTTSYPLNTTTITLPTAADVNVLPGYEFTGWTTTLTGTVTPGGSTIAIPTGTTSATITAVITPIAYTIEYYKQDGTVLTDSDFIHPYVPTRAYNIVTHPSGVTLPVQGQVAAPAGERFVKWITNPLDESTVITSTAITAGTPRVLTVYAVYESNPTPVTYTLHYFYNDDNHQRQDLSFNVTVQTQYPEGTTSITLPTPDKIVIPTCYSFGYEFDKWLVNGVQTNVITITPGINTDINVEAVFKVKEYPISYFINLNGTNTQTTAAASGVYTVLAPVDLAAISIINAPNAWEYEFAGWVKENGDPIANNRVEAVSGQPIIDKVFAKYTPVQYEIKYYSSEDNHEMLDNEFVTPPERYYSVATGTKALPASGITAPAGKHFVEWRTNPADAGSVITATPAINQSSSRVLNVYAIFEDDSAPITYTVKYYYVDALNNDQWVSLGIADDVYTSTGTKALPANNLVPTREFYMPFDGSWTSSDVVISGNQFTISAGSPLVINIFAEYTPVSYTVNFHNVTWNGMYNPLPTFNIENEWQIPGENEVAAPVGKKFLHWEDSNGTVVSELKVDANTPNPLNLYPVYENYEYTIEYKNPNGTTITLNQSSAATTTFTVDDLASIVFATSTDFTAPLGKIFDNKWLDENGNEVIAITTAHLEALGTGRTIELTAVYINKVYTLTLDIGPGYTVGFTPVPTFTIDTIPYLPTASDGMILHIRDYAYEFKYWKNAQDERVDIITLPEQGDSVELFAYYELIPYSVQYFEKDNPTQEVTFFNFTPVEEYDYEDGEIALPGTANVVAPARKELDYWEDADGNRVESLKVEDGTPSNLVLYAVWKNKQVEQYNVSYQDKFGTSVSFITTVPTSYPGTTQEFDLPLANNVIINTPGYTFKEWLYNGAAVANNKFVIDPDTTPENIVITADLYTTPYYVTFFDDDGISNVTWTSSSFIPPYEYNADMSSLPPLPGPSDVKADLGYEFDYWADENGQRVDALSIDADTNTNLKLRAVYKEKVYTLRFINTELPYNIHTDNDVQSLSGGTFTRTFTISDVATIALPTNSEVVAPEYYDLECWEYENGTEVALPLALPTEGDVLKLYTFWQPEKYIVTYKYMDENLGDPNAEPDKVNDVKFVDGETIKYEWYEHEVYITFPAIDKVVVKRGYEVLGWTVTGQQTSPYSLRRNVQFVQQITIDESLLPFIEVSLVTQEKEYTVNFTNATFNDDVETVFTVTRPLTLPANGKVVTEPGWKFIEWQYNGSPVTAISLDVISDSDEAAGKVDITAEYEAKEYSLTLLNDDGTAIQYIDNYDAPKSFTVDSGTVLPDETQVVAPDGMEFDKWVVNGQEVTSLASLVTAETTNYNAFTVYATYKEKEYEVNFVGAIVDPSVQTIFTKSSGTLTFPSDDKVTPELGYKFIKWLRNGAEITAISFDDLTSEEKESGVVTITADCQIINYPVKFLNFDDKVTPVQFKDEYENSVPTTFNVKSNTALPENGWVEAPNDKEFDNWVDAGGKAIASPLQVTAGMTEEDGLTVYATYKDIEPQTYTIEYYFTETTPAKFITGYDAPTTFTEDTVDSIVLPTGDKLDLTGTGYNQFIEWRTDLTDPATKVESIILTADTPSVIKLYAFCKTEYSVRFFEGMTSDESYILGISPIDSAGHVVAFPDVSDFGDKGYEETPDVAAVYENREYTDVTKPGWWYLDANDNLVEFTDKTVVEGDLDVYLLSKKFGMLLVFHSTNFPMIVTASYNDDSRVLDSVKNLAVSGRNQLNAALALNKMPSYYYKAKDKIVDKLIDTGVIEVVGDDKNIQIITVPLRVSQFVREDIANGVIKKYLRSVVNNPAELDRIFDLIDVAEFADQLGIDAIINGMTDAEILSLMKSDANKSTVIDFVMTDLKKTDSAMLDFVIDYVINDSTFREKLIDDLIAELKNEKATSSLKSQALTYIKSQIDDSKSAFYGKFVEMVYADLISANSVVMDAVVSFVRTNIAADTDAGRELREAILTSSQLSDFLNNELMKEKVIELALTDNFIDKALDNVDYRTVLVEAIMADNDFIDILLSSTEFHDYIVDQLHGTHELAADVKALIADTTSAFRKHVLDIVKDSPAFEKLFDEHPELKDVISDEFEWYDFVASDEELLKYVFQQGAVTGTYTFISRADIEAAIAREYNSLPQASWTGNYETLNDDEKQTIRDNLYGDADARLAVLNEIKSKFNSYKEDIVNKVTSGKIDEITDETAHNLVDTLLADYVTKYINQEKLNADDAINASITGVIEGILFDLIADLIKGVDLNDAELDAELANMMSHIDTVKHQFVVDPTPAVVAKLKDVVKNYRNTHYDDVKSVVNTNYAALTGKLTDMINPEHANSVYSEVEGVLKSLANTIDDSLIKGYVNSVSETDLKDLIRKYMKNLTVADINKYIATFLNASADNVESVKTELRAFITDSQQRTTVEDLAKTYISDSSNDATIRSKVSDFINDIDEAFINTNRSFIETALRNLDLSAFVDEQFVKDYVAGLDGAGKTAFADKIYNGLTSNADYSKLMKQLLNSETIEVNKSNLSMVKAVSNALQSLTIESIIDFITTNETVQKLVDKFGVDFIEPYFNAMIAKYCDGLDEVIADVDAATDADYKKNFTTTVILRVDAIAMLKKLYNKAAPKVIEKLNSKAGVYYKDNIYLKYLVEEQDIFAELFNGDASLASGDFTGYSVKSIIEYYEYLLSLLIVGDDAITWYGDRDEGLSQEHYDALYDAIIGKAVYVQDQLDEILADYRATGDLPDKIEALIDKVSQINTLITRFEPQIKKIIDKYLASNLEVDQIAGSDKAQTALDILLGSDDPTFTLDMFYDIFYKYDDKAQAKLKQLIDSGKLRKAIDKFYATSAAEIIKGNATLAGNDKVKKLADIIDEIKSKGKVTSTFENIYDVLVILAEYGLDAYKTAENEKKDVGGAYTYTEDEYTISVGDISFSISRFYESPGWVG